MFLLFHALVISGTAIGLSYRRIAHRFSSELMGIQPTVIPTVQIRPNMILVYDQLLWPGSRPKKPEIPKHLQLALEPEISTLDFLKKDAYSGELCNHSKKRLSKAINLLCAIAQEKEAENFRTGGKFKFKVNFVTLTLPAPQGTITDRELKQKALDPWIKSMKRLFGLKNYVWKAERQFNGNLHFHITSDCYLPLDKICSVWNRQLDRLGFIDEFFVRNGHRHPNSTDVHSVQKIRNLAAYMVKYMSKSPEAHLRMVNAKLSNAGKRIIKPDEHSFRSVPGQPTWDQPIQGKVWDCSTNLKLKSRCETEISGDISSCIQALKDTFPDQCHYSDHCLVIYANSIPMTSILDGKLLAMWIKYLDFIRSHDTADPAVFGYPFNLPINKISDRLPISRPYQAPYIPHTVTETIISLDNYLKSTIEKRQFNLF